MAAAAVVSAAPVALDAVMLTTAAMNAHNALGGRLASSILGSSRAMPGAVSDSTGGIMKQLEGARREDDDGSSVLSSVPSSDLSDLSSEDGDSPRKPVKRRRKNMLTPPTSVDEPNSKRANGRKLIREGPTEYDVEDRKEYFEAGLYSGATNNLGKNAGRAKMQRRITAKGAVRLSRPLEEVVENFKFGLPLFHGLTLLQQERDFRLPWDIRNDFDLSCLPETAEGLTFRSDAWDRVGRQKKPAPYKQISQNRLTWRQKDEADPVAICDCPVGDCGDYCLNRVMQFFCSARYCKSGKQCTNLPFSTRRVQHDLEVFWTGNRGFGLRTNTPIKAGAFVMQYVGEIITINESYRRTINEYKDRHDYYFLDYFDAEVVDAGLMGNESRFVNHSCDPNVEVVRWKLADYDEYQIGLFALRDIDAKEELSYDYGWQAFASIDTKADASDGEKVKDEAPKQRCLCAGPSCTGFFEKSEKVKEKKAAIMSKNQKKTKGKPTMKRSDSAKGKTGRA